MTNNHYILIGAAVAFVLALLYAARKRATTATLLNSVATTLKPVEAAVMAEKAKLGAVVKDLDAKALDDAAAQLESELQAALAQSHKSRLQAILAPKDQAAPASPPGS